MNVIETNLKFTSLSKRASTRRIIIHHEAASGMTVQQIHDYHKNVNGWAGIGYHYFIRKDGKVYRGRPEYAVGSHASGNNADSIGICFEGNYEVETSMPEAQKEAGKELVADIKARYNINTVQRHSDVNATACPGKNLPFDEISTGASANIGKWVKSKNTGKWWFEFTDGTWPNGQWLLWKGKWYWFDDDGWMVESTCLEINGEWYAFSASGAMFADGVPTKSPTSGKIKFD